MARILIVEDVRFISKVLASLFEDRGHVVDIAVDGREALETARRDLPELMLSDISMPKIDGLEVARRLKSDSETAVIPIMMVTSRTDPEAMAAANEAGVDAYMRKPFETKQLIAKATELLGGFPMNYAVACYGEAVVLRALATELADEAADHLPEAMAAARAASAGMLVLDLSRIQKVELGCVDGLLPTIQEAANQRLIPAVEPGRGMGVRAFRDRLAALVEWHPDLASALSSLGVPTSEEERPVRLGTAAPETPAQAG